MKTIAFCLVALFASILAAPLVEEDEFEIGPFGDSSWEDGVNEASGQDIEDKIMGGSETTIQNHPYIFNVAWRGWHQGGGSVLTSTRGLTTGAKFRDNATASYFTIMAGSTTLAGDANQQVRTISRYLIHPNYSNHPRHLNNIAIAYWEKPLTFGDFVQPIALPRQGTVPDYTKLATVTGWGSNYQLSFEYSKILKSVTVPLVKNEICNGTTMYDGTISAEVLCAGAPERGRGTCNGDTGNPLVVNNLLIGVAAWQMDCAVEGFPGTYTRVSLFTNWIRKNL